MTITLFHQAFPLLTCGATALKNGKLEAYLKIHRLFKILLFINLKQMTGAPFFLSAPVCVCRILNYLKYRKFISGVFQKIITCFVIFIRYKFRDMK